MSHIISAQKPAEKIENGDKALAVFDVLLDWPNCYLCKEPVKPWTFSTFHPTCYLRYIMDSFPNLFKSGHLSELMDCALDTILNG